VRPDYIQQIEARLARCRLCTDDPVAFLGAVPDRAQTSRGHLEPTWGQYKLLREAGLSTVKGLTRALASGLIEALENRKQAGLCTYKQARTLAKHGLDPNMTYERAREVLNELRANNWQATPEMLAEAGA
jgi:hypothetical protein